MLSINEFIGDGTVNKNTLRVLQRLEGRAKKENKNWLVYLMEQDDEMADIVRRMVRSELKAIGKIE
jgi:hypothetical protein